MNVERPFQRSLLGASDLTEAVRLSQVVGWNQTEADWLRLFEVNPETCFIFREGDRTVGTSTLAAYGQKLAWIGMVIVDLPFRGRGAGKVILESTIAEAQAREYEIIGLDATDEGRRLYVKYGFHDVQPIDRWSGVLRVTGPAGGTHYLETAHLQDMRTLDNAWSGCNRGPLLMHLFEEKETVCLGISRGGRLRGFAFLRPGRHFFHLGPLAAETEADCQALLDAAAAAAPGRPVIADALRREETESLLKPRGLEVQRRLTRMTLGSARPVLNNAALWLASAFEWG